MKFCLTLALFVVVAVSALPHNKIRPLARRLHAGSSRIVGGSPAELGQFPYQAAIWADYAGTTNFCGGSLISADWVLTSANCAFKTIRFRIDLGIIDLERPNVQVTASKAFIHPDHDGITADIVLLQLDAAVHFNANIQPVRLNGAYIGAGQNAIASGWGYTSDSDTGYSQFLNWAVLKTMDNAECNSTYHVIDDGIICCTRQGPVKSICNYDWGDPLVLGEGSSALLIGIAIFPSIYGCDSGFPSGFTRISFYRDWIREVSGV